MEKHGETGQLDYILEIVFDTILDVIIWLVMIACDAMNLEILIISNVVDNLKDQSYRTVREYTIKLCRVLGYEILILWNLQWEMVFYCNETSVIRHLMLMFILLGQQNFDWIVENAADMAIKKQES